MSAVRSYSEHPPCPPPHASLLLLVPSVELLGTVFVFLSGMGSKDHSTPSKPSKPATAAQDVPTTPYPEWLTPVPAYYGAGPPTPAFYPPTVTSPTPHPYMWGGQHLMPPYGTPLPCPPIYPHGALYAHPAMTPVAGTAVTGREIEGKAANGKERGSTKKSEGRPGISSGKSGNGGKAVSGSTSDDALQSDETGSDGSSVASDENGNQQGTTNKKRCFDLMRVDGANAQQNNAAGDSSISTRPAKLPVSAPGKVAAPATNLNIGMDLWSGSPAGGVPVKGRPATVSQGIAPHGVVGREGLPPEQMWINDERELKRQRRKQSNRESARRSRLRKQVEYEELAAKAEALSNENQTLRTELQCLAEKCEKLASENKSMTEQLKEEGIDPSSSKE